MGDFDFVKVVLDRIGDMRWMQIAIRPAKPFAFGTGGRRRAGVRAARQPGVVDGVASSCSPGPRCAAMAGHAGSCTAPRWRRRRPRRFRRRPDGKTHFVRVVAERDRRRRAAGALGRRAGLPPAHRHGRGPRPGRAPRRRRPGRGRPRRGPPPRPRSERARPAYAWAGHDRCRRARGPPTARRLVRPGAPRPADLGHRPLQLPLHLLHARGGHEVAARGTSSSPSRRSSGSARVLVERHGIESIRLTGGEPTVRAHLPGARREARRPRRSTSPLTTNGATLRTVAHDLAAAGLRRVNISLDTLRRDRFAELTRRDELDRRARRHRRRPRGRARAGQGQRRRGAGRQRRRGRRPRHLRPRAGRAGPLHRVHAARRRARAGANDQVVSQAEIVARHRRRVPARAAPSAVTSRPSGSATSTARARSASSPASPARSASSATASGSPPRASCGPACSRSTSTTCAGPAVRRRSTTSCPTSSRPASAPSGPATPSTRCTSSAPPESMSQIGG